MADEQSGRPLRRWRPFYGAFGSIDDAIEAAGHPRAAYRDMRVRILKMLRGTEDDAAAEQLCAALDDAMAKSLETLQVVPVPRSKPVSSDLARAVGALRSHGSARIRSLASDVVRGLAAATEVEEELDDDKLSGDRVPLPRRGISTVVADGNARGPAVPAADKKKLLIPPAKKLPAAAATAAAEIHRKKKLSIPAAKILPAVPVAEAQKKVYASPAKMVPAKKPAAVDESKKMEAAKRKLREGYDEAEKIKRQRTTQKIKDSEAAKMFEQKQQKMRSIVRGRGPAPAACRSRTISGIRRSLLPPLQMI